MGSPGLQTLSRSGSAPFTHPRSYGRTACEEHPSPEQPAVPDLQPVALKALKHVACSPWFSGSDAPISSRGLRTSAFTGTRALLPGVSCATLDECEKNPVVEKSPRTHPATGLSGSGCGSPRLRAAALLEASANHPSHLTPGVSIAAWSGCGCVFPGIGPKLRHCKTRWIRNQLQASPEPTCLRQTSARRPGGGVGGVGSVEWDSGAAHHSLPVQHAPPPPPSAPGA